MNADRVADVLDEVVMIIESSPQDLTWAGYWSDAAEAAAELRDEAARLRRGDIGGLAELRVLFGPGCPLQDMAMAGGWTDRYLVLAERFDTASAGP